jgi:hypothetical protein
VRRVEREEWSFCALALGVNGARDQLLSGARFAEDQYRGAGRRDGIDDLVHVPHLLGLTRELAIVRQSLELGGQPAILLLHAELVEQLGNLDLELVEALGVERLLDVVRGAFLHRLDRELGAPLPGDHHELGGDALRPDRLEQSDSVQLRHLEIGEHDAESLGLQPFQRLLPVGGDFHLVTRVRENGAQAIRDCRFVIRDENSSCLCLLGALCHGDADVTGMSGRRASIRRLFPLLECHLPRWSK